MAPIIALEANLTVRPLSIRVDPFMLITMPVDVSPDLDRRGPVHLGRSYCFALAPRAERQSELIDVCVSLIRHPTRYSSFSSIFARYCVL